MKQKFDNFQVFSDELYSRPHGYTLTLNMLGRSTVLRYCLQGEGGRGERLGHNKTKVVSGNSVFVFLTELAVSGLSASQNRGRSCLTSQ